VHHVKITLIKEYTAISLSYGGKMQ
jgi:hypothetical protein